MTEPLTFRRRVEKQAGPVIVLIARLPRVVPFLVVLGLVLGGLLLTGPAAATLLTVLALLLGVLLFLGWPALPAPSRVLRLAVVLLVLASAASRL